MIRSYCQNKITTLKSSLATQSRICGKLTRARRYHKYCRACHLQVEGIPREISHQHRVKKEKVVKTKPIPEQKKRRK